MDRTATATTSVAPEDLFEIVADLATYPSWLDLVTQVEPVVGAEHAWLVTLRARVGPLARSKRLRMVRTVHDSPQSVRFERRETDGRNHSNWTLDATVSPHAEGSQVTMRLRYDGSLWSGLLDAGLGRQIEKAAEGLRSHTESR